MNSKLSSFLWYSTIVLTILLAFIGVSVLATADVPDIAIYNKAIPSDEPLLFASIKTDDNASHIQSWLDEDGRIHINSSKHLESQTILINEQVIKNLKGYNGKEVMLYHVNDAGITDSSRLVPIQSDGTWTYFYDVEFSEVIIDGYVGTWEITAYNLSVSDSLNLGQEANGSKTEYVHVNVTDDANKAHPYDINTIGIVGWWEGDGNANDSSCNGYNGTAYNTTYINMKYDEGFSFAGVDNYVDLGIFDISYPITIGFYINTTDTGNYKRIFTSSSSNSYPFTIGLSGGHVTFADTNNIDSIKTISSINGAGNVYVLISSNGAQDSTCIYINNENQSLVNYGGFTFSNINCIASRSGVTGFLLSNIDNLLIYNKILSKSERNNLYYDNLQQLQIKTNSNSTWSTEWNSTADNPIQVPYADGELFSLLNFTVPETVVQNGITIYDYPSTVQFDAVATVGYTEDITKITESAASGTYTLNVTHAAGNTGEGYINYTTANSVLLDADFWNSAVLTTDNPNASLSTTLPHFNISTGYVAATTEYYYLVEQDYFYPPTNIQTTPSQCCVNITWDAVPNADNYSIYELEDGFPYVDTNPTVDGVKDAIYNYSHEFLIFSPNPVTVGDYETSYPVRTSLGAYFFHEAVDNDDKLGDDDLIYYFDLDNDGLTVDDPAWKITNNIVKKYLWNGGSWQVTGVSDAVGASTGGGSHYPKHELFIPVAELGANWTNGSIVKVLVKREDSSLTPDVVTWYPYGNVNDTDTNLWQEMVLNYPDSYTLLANVTLSNYTALNLTSFTIYHGAVSAWNGTDESDYTLFDVITEDVLVYNVSGYVFDDLGNTLAGAIVYSCNVFVHEITQTDIYGYWIGYNFRDGNYTICANKSGYADNSIDIYVSTNLTNQNITLTAFEMTDWVLWEKLLEIEALLDVEESAPTEITKMTYQIFILLIIIDLLAVWYSFTNMDKSYYTDIITSLLAVIISGIISYNSIIGVSYYFATQYTVHEIEYTSVSLMVLFASVSIVMLIFFVTKILELTHEELDNL